MSTAVLKRRYTPEEYLVLEAKSLEKHEYYKSEIFAMPGGTSVHSGVTFNLGRVVGNVLFGKPCRGFESNMRVKVQANGLYTYPDASIACPPIEFELLRGGESLVNPVVLFEVLSPITEGYDRGAKFNLYRDLPSLKEYFLISQNSPVVERRSRRDDGTWSVDVATGLEATIKIASVDGEMRLAELYDKIEFPNLNAETNESSN